MAEVERSPSALLLLKWPLLALVLGVIASGLFVAGSFTYLRQEQANEKTSKRALVDAQARIGNANKEIEDLLASVDTYKRMRERGLFSEPSRLVWIERVAALRERHRIASLEYVLGPRTLAPLREGDSFPSLDVLASPIQMTILSLHDGDLVGFLGEISSLGAGAFPINRCVTKMLPETQGAPLAPRLETQCNLLWVTLVDKRMAEARPPSAAAPLAAPSKER